MFVERRLEVSRVRQVRALCFHYASELPYHCYRLREPSTLPPSNLLLASYHPLSEDHRSTPGVVDEIHLGRDHLSHFGALVRHIWAL